MEEPRTENSVLVLGKYCEEARSVKLDKSTMGEAVPAETTEDINETKEEDDKEWKWKENQKKEIKQDNKIIEEYRAQDEETVEKEREERNRKAKERKRERDRIYQANKREERREYRNRYGIDMVLIKKKKEGPRTRDAEYSRRYREKKKEKRVLMKYLEE
eukprot:sb/3472908/